MTRPGLERAGGSVLIAAIALTTVNLLTAQVLFGLASLAWLYLIVTDARRPALPVFCWPLAAYAALTVASALVASARTHGLGSLEQLTQFFTAPSVIDLKQLVLFLMVPMVLRFLPGGQALRAMNVVIAVGSAAALLGVVEYTMFGYDNLGHRPLGSLTHYMTYSGVIMLVLSVAVARLLFYPQQFVWPAVAVPALAVALGTTQTRGAWIGAGIAILGLLAYKRPKLLWLAPVAAVVALLVTPTAIQSRARSIFDTNDESNRDRIQMAGMGAAMVRDHPWFGVGPDMVGPLYAQYLPPNPVKTYNPHLHNVPIQIAAERGLPALAAWLAFIVLVAAGLARSLRRGRVPALAAAGLASMLAMLAAGLFEYNFGDSEFLMLFLALITLPFASDGGSPSADGGARHDS